MQVISTEPSPGRSGDAGAAWVWLIGGFVFFLTAARLWGAVGDGFSYDYRNYISYLRSIQELDWRAVEESLEFTFPYVFVSTAVFEPGFVLVSAGLLNWLSPTACYALMAGASVALRTVALRRLGLGWGWILPLQMYAITLFEANALRAGVALTLSLLGIWGLLSRRWVPGLLALALAPLFHFQALLFIVPWVLVLMLPRAALARPGRLLGVLGLVGVCTLLVLQWVPELRTAKLEEYAVMSSGAAGLNLVSGLGLLWVLAAVWEGFRLAPEAAEHRRVVAALAVLWMSILVLLSGGALATVADRIWQFAFVIGVAALNPVGRPRGLVVQVALGGLLAVALLNVLWRYPLSNFFVPLVPEARIVPLWFAP